MERMRVRLPQYEPKVMFGYIVSLSSTDNFIALFFYPALDEDCNEKEKSLFIVERKPYDNPQKRTNGHLDHQSMT